MLRANLSFDFGDHVLEIGVDNEENVATAATQFAGGFYYPLDPSGLYAAFTGQGGGFSR